MLKRLWHDTHGSVISSEVAVVGAVLIIGVIVGLSALRMAIITEAQDLGEAVHAIDFTPKVKPIRRAPTDTEPSVAGDLLSD